MSPLINSRLFQETVTFTASQDKWVDINKEALLQELFLWLSGVVTHTDVTTPPVCFLLSPLGLITRLEVIADGSKVLKSYSGQHLALLNAAWGNVAPKRTAPGLTAAAHTFNALLHIPFAIQKSINSIDTILNPAEYNSFQLKVSWGAGMTSLFSTQPTAGTITTAATIQVLGGRSIGGVPKRRNLFRQYTQQVYVDATSAEKRIQITGKNMIRGLTIITERDGDPVDNILNSFEIKRGGEVVWPSKRLIEQAAGAYLSETATPLVGVYIVDFTQARPGAKEGYLSECLDVRDWDYFTMISNVTKTSGTEYIYIIPDVVELRAPIG